MKNRLTVEFWKNYCEEDEYYTISKDQVNRIIEILKENESFDEKDVAKISISIGDKITEINNYVKAYSSSERMVNSLYGIETDENEFM